MKNIILLLTKNESKHAELMSKISALELSAPPYILDIEETILQLIECDIISTKLIRMFCSIGIDASNYWPNISKIIFTSLGITEEQRTDDFYEKYLRLIDEGKHINVDSKRELRKLALNVYKALLVYV